MTPYLTVVLTSLVAYVFARNRRRLRTIELARALGRMADLLGTGVIFALVNVAAAVAIVLGLRAVTDRFVSLYSVADPVWLAVSMLQGCLWRLWHESQRDALC
jgi:hypothetical protein